MADYTFTRRGLIASSLLVAGAAATGAVVAPVVAAEAGFDAVFDAALLKYDDALRSINTAPDHDDSTWAGLTDEWLKAADQLLEMPAPDLQCYRAKLARAFEHYGYLEERISFAHSQLLLDDLARLVPA